MIDLMLGGTFVMKLKPILLPNHSSLKNYDIILTKGLPASGKTTWAKEFAKKNGFTIISRDDIRRNVFNGGKLLKPEQEKLVTNYQQALLDISLSFNLKTILCDTFLNPNSFEIIDKTGVNYAVVDFTNVPLYECMKRDYGRPDSVGSNVIANMFENYLKPAYIFEENLPSVYIVDIDGTVATMDKSRRAFEWDKVYLDQPKDYVIELLENKDVIFFSGRDSECYDLTWNWLKEHIHPSTKFQLFMRPTKDNRKDYVVKKELYFKHIKNKYNVKACIDDRLSVCCMWLELGLDLIRIGNPLLDF